MVGLGMLCAACGSLNDLPGMYASRNGDVSDTLWLRRDSTFTQHASVGGVEAQTEGRWTIWRGELILREPLIVNDRGDSLVRLLAKSDGIASLSLEMFGLNKSLGVDENGTAYRRIGSSTAP
jgi:hypothetical protein